MQTKWHQPWLWWSIHRGSEGNHIGEHPMQFMTTKGIHRHRRSRPTVPKQARDTSNRSPTQLAAGAEESLARVMTKRAEYSNLLDHTLGTIPHPNNKATSHKTQEWNVPKRTRFTSSSSVSPQRICYVWMTDTNWKAMDEGRDVGSGGARPTPVLTLARGDWTFLAQKYSKTCGRTSGTCPLGQHQRQPTPATQDLPNCHHTSQVKSVLLNLGPILYSLPLGRLQTSLCQWHHHQNSTKRGIDQPRHSLSWIIYAFAEAAEEEKNFMEKWDVKNGCWHMNCREGKQWNFAYILPQLTGEPIVLVILLLLQMRWVESPPFFLL